MKAWTSLIAVLIMMPASGLIAQDIMDLLNDKDSTKTEYTYATFKSTKLIHGQTVEIPKKGALDFVISHHFGRINSGAYEFFGLDQANIRFGFDYGIFEWLSVGIGRTSVDKTYDGSVKIKILRQSKGYRKMPVSLTYFTNMTINTLKWSDPERTNYFSSKLEYNHQLLIARKFGANLSLQVMPTFIHRNLVKTNEDHNDIWAIGGGGRIKVSKRVAITGEYYYLLPNQTAEKVYNSASIGVDLETGGHVFQIFLTNSLGLIEEQFIPETTGQWKLGDIHIGFNIHRTFQLVKEKNKENK